jgi:site-specific DNA recombinase
MKEVQAPRVNAVIYARYSSHSQTEQSIEGQLHDCHAYAERNNYAVVGEYIDRAISGRTDDRPDFQRMIEDAPKKQFEKIIVWKLDRFARNRYDSALYKHKLKQYGVRVISAMENVGEGDESILLEALLEASAEYYSLDLKKKIKRGQRESIAKGLYCGGPVPYGYKLVDKKLKIDERTAPTMRYIFEQYAQGTSMKDIIDELTRRGVKSSRGTPLNYNTFSRAIVNPTYIGEYHYAGELIEGLAEPMVSKDIFERVQARVKSKAIAPASARKVEYLLQGKLFCGHCGATMIGECGKGRHGSMFYYYTCSTRKKSHTCQKHNERKDDLEYYVVSQTLQYILTPARIKEIAESIVAAYEKEFDTKKIKSLEKTITRIDYELTKLTDALIEAPAIARKRIYDKMEQLEAEKSSTEVDLAKLRIASEIRFTQPEVEAWLKSFCTGTASDPDFRRRIIDTFINSVYLYDDRILLFYNLKHQSQTLHPTPADLPEPESSSTGSTMIANAPLYAMKHEPLYFFLHGVFGCVIQRTES